MMEGLIKTRSTFLTPEVIINRSGLSRIGVFGIFTFLFISAILIGLVIVTVKTNAQLLYTFGLVFILCGAGLVLAGWLQFSLLQKIEDIPEAKIEGAAEGLNNLQGLLVAESGTGLISPIAKTECVFYQVELQGLVHTRNGSYWDTLALYSQGTPTLLTDNTGYLALDLPNAIIDRGAIGGRRFFVVDDQDREIFTSSKEGKDLMNYIQTSPEKFDPATVGVTLSGDYKDRLALFGEQLSILESCIITKQGAFVMGRTTGSLGEKDGKVVKAMVYDASTKLLSVSFESKENLEKRDRNLVYSAFIFGLLFLIAGIWIAFSANTLGAGSSSFISYTSIPYDQYFSTSTYYTTIPYTTIPYTTIGYTDLGTLLCADHFYLNVGNSINCYPFMIKLLNVSYNGPSSPPTASFAEYENTTGKLNPLGNITVSTAFATGAETAYYSSSYQRDVTQNLQITLLGICTSVAGNVCSMGQSAQISLNVTTRSYNYPSTTSQTTTISQAFETTIPPASDGTNCPALIPTQQAQTGWYTYSDSQSANFGAWSNDTEVGYTECYGMPYSVNYGLRKTFPANSLKTKISFDWKMQSQTNLSSVTNFAVLVDLPNGHDTTYTLLSGGIQNSGWQNYTQIVNTTGVQSFNVTLYSFNNWAAYYGQMAVWKNFNVTNA